MKKALITGITGQDGSYLAEFLLEKGYEVHGVIRRSSLFNTGRIDHLYEDPHTRNVRVFLHYGDLSDGSSIEKILTRVEPDEIYNLGAQSHVRVSFDIPEYTGNVTALGALRILEAMRESETNTRYYQAGSSEMFGLAQETPQKENTPFYPRSPYGIAKLYAHWITTNYREGYGMFASNGILFNHESPRRGKTFVTRKITSSLSEIKAGTLDKFYLGNLDAKRDWGYAKDFVEGMWMILQHKEPDDFILATNETHTVREFVEEAAKHADMEIVWKGKGEKEKGVNRKSGKVIVEKDPRYYRPTEVDLLQGDFSKARKKLGWKPKTTFKKLAQIMMEADLKEAYNKK